MQRCHTAVEGMMEYTRFRGEPAAPVNLHMVLEDADLDDTAVARRARYRRQLEMTQGLPPVVANVRGCSTR